MSQLYHVSLSESVSRQIKSKDEVSYPIRLTEILPVDEMRVLLEQTLVDEGFVKEDDGTLSKTGSAGERIKVNLDAMEVIAEIESETDYNQEIHGQGLYDTDFGREGKRQATEEAEAELKREREGAEKAADALAQRKQRELSKRLDESDAARVRLLNEVTQRVYAEALKRKAHQLGDVISIQESTSAQGEYQLTIKVSQ